MLLNFFIACKILLHDALACSAEKCLCQSEAGTDILFFLSVEQSKLGLSCVLYNILYSDICIFFIG